MYFVSKKTGIADFVPADPGSDLKFCVMDWIKKKLRSFMTGKDLVCCYSNEGDLLEAFTAVAAGTLTAVTPYGKELPCCCYILDDGQEIHGPNPWEALISISRFKFRAGELITVFDPDKGQVFNYQKLGTTLFGPKGDYCLPGGIKTEPRKSFDMMVLIESYFLENY